MDQGWTVKRPRRGSKSTPSVLPAAEEPEAEPEAEEEESPLYPDAAEDEQDYVKAFENAVYQTPDTADEDAPKISF